MIKLNENYEVDRRILKCEYIRYSPAETSTINTPNSQIYINIPSEDSVISLLNSFLDMNFEGYQKPNNSRYGNGNDIRLGNLFPISLFGNFKLSTSGGVHLGVISHVHIVSLMYKLITPIKNSDDLSFGFDRNRNRRRVKLTNNKNVKGKYHLRIKLKDVFGFAKHQEKATYGLSFKLTLSKDKDQAVIDKAAGVADARFKIDQTHWYLTQYTPPIQQQRSLSNQFLKQNANRTQMC